MTWRDWPDNPIFVKHLRSRLRLQPTLVGAAVVLLICLCIAYAGLLSEPIDARMMFSALIALQFLILGIVGSMQAATAVGGAKASGILDFHRASPLTPRELASGFWLGAPIREWLLTALALPFLLLACGLGYPTLKGLVQAEVLIAATSLTLQALALLGGLALRGGMSGSNALAGSLLVIFFVAGPVIGLFSQIPRLLDEAPRLDFMGLSLPWLAFVLIHLAAVGSFAMLAVTRKMESDRIPGLSKRQAIAAMAVFSALAMGGMGNWRESVSPRMVALYGLTGLALGLIATSTPTRADCVRGARRALKRGGTTPPLLDDSVPNRPVVAAIVVILLAAGLVFGAGTTHDPLKETPPGFLASVACAALVATSFGLANQDFQMRFGRRAAIYFGLFLFVAWILPLMLGVATSVATGSSFVDTANFFAASPIVGIASAASAFEDEPDRVAGWVALGFALAPALVFAVLEIRSARRVRESVVRAETLADELKAESTPA